MHFSTITLKLYGKILSLFQLLFRLNQMGVETMQALLQYYFDTISIAIETTIGNMLNGPMV